MIKAGDKVRFLNAVGGGVVKSVISKTMVNVEDYDGFEIPTLISELVVLDECRKALCTDSCECK